MNGLDRENLIEFLLISDGSTGGMHTKHHRHRRHPAGSTSKGGQWSPSMELYYPTTPTTVGPDAWVFAEHNHTAAASSRPDAVVRAHIGSTAVLDCVVKKGSQYGMVSERASA